MHPWRGLLVAAPVLVGLGGLFPVSAQGSNLPAPAAGTYSCYAINVTTALQYQYRPFSAGTSNGFMLVPVEQPQVQPSALGKFTLDGKGRYTHVDMTGKPLGAGKGTYTFDKASGKVKFAGSLADNKNYSLKSYRVHRSGEFTFSFNVGCVEHTCVTFVKGDPLPTVKNPNGNLSGVLNVGQPNKGYDVSLQTGQVIWSGDGLSMQRLAGGLTAYALFGNQKVTSNSNAGQVVFAREGGQVLARLAQVVWADSATPPLFVNSDGTRVLVGEGYNFRKADTLSGIEQIYPRWKLMNASGQVLGYTDEAYIHQYVPMNLPAFLPDGRILMPRYDDKLLYVYDANLKGKKLFVQEPSTMPVVSPDGKVVAMLRGNQVVFTTTGGVELRRVNIQQGLTVNAMTFSPDGKYLAFGVNNGKYRIDILAFMPVTGKELSPLLDHKGEPLEVEGLGYRLSWWTGKPTLPPAWKNGVPSGSAGGAGTSAGTPRPTTPRATTTPQTAQSQPPAGRSLWPAWLPTARVQLGSEFSGVLNLSTPLNRDNQQGLGGTSRADGHEYPAAFLVDTSKQLMALLVTNETDTLMCVIRQEKPAELSGELYLSEQNATPQPLGESCRLWTP